MPASNTLFSRTRYTLGTSLTLCAPVVQASLGSCDGPLLAAAVSRAGGLGCLTVHTIKPEALRRRLRQIRSLTRRPVLIAFTYQWQSDALLTTCLEEGFRHFQVFWWNGPRLTRTIQSQGGTIFWQVGSQSQAADALECGANSLIVPGTEAGGPVRTPFGLRELLTTLLVQTEEKIPIVAGGGLATRSDVEAVLRWGASAALLGTRFLLSDEAQAPRQHKARLARAKTENLYLDPRIRGEWPCAPRRRLTTLFAPDTPSLFAGRGLSRIRSILPAAQIVRQLTPRFTSAELPGS